MDTRDILLFFLVVLTALFVLLLGIQLRKENERDIQDRQEIARKAELGERALTDSKKCPYCGRPKIIVMGKCLICGAPNA